MGSQRDRIGGELEPSRTSWRPVPLRSSTTIQYAVCLSRVRGLDENHPAAMRDRLRQRRVAVVLGVDEIDVRSGVPFTQTDAGPSIPSEDPDGSTWLTPSTTIVLCAAVLRKKSRHRESR